MSFMRKLVPNKSASKTERGGTPTRVIRSDSFYDSSPAFTFLTEGRCMTMRSGRYRERTVIVSQVDDGRKLVSFVTDHYVVSILLSNDGRWIILGELPYPKSHKRDTLATVWDAKTYKKATEIKYDEQDWNGQLMERVVDASPDSTRFAMSSKTGLSLCVWSITTGECLLGPLLFGEALYAKHVKFSPYGDRLAIAVVSTISDSPGRFHVYDSQTGHLLIDILGVDISSFTWCSDSKRIFATIGDKFQCLDVSVSFPRFTDFELAMCNTYIALARNGRFLVSLGEDSSIAFWDTSTLTQIGPSLEHCADERLSSIFLSADNGYLAGIISGRKRSITIWSLREILPQFYFMKIPLIRVSEAAFVPWVQNNLSITDTTLSDEIVRAPSPNHEALANRALVRARLCQWREARDDAEKSLGVHPSVVAHIAKAFALTGQGQYESAMWEFDLVLRDSNSSEHDLLWLIKCIITFVSGRHNIAISRVRELASSASVNDKGLHSLVQAKMCDLLGDIYKSQGDFHGASQSFEQAVQLYRQAQPSTMYHATPTPQVISLIFGWQFEHLGMVVQQHWCEALLATGRVKDAAESLHHIIKTFNGEIGTDREVLDWILGFKQRCATSFENLGDEALHADKVQEALGQYSSGLSLEPPSPHSLFIKRSKARTTIGLWQQGLEDADEAVALDPLSPWGYERKLAALYGLHRYDEAIEALNEMLSRLKSSSDPQSCKLRQQGINPPHIATAISKIVTETQRRSPLVLVNTDSGRLCDKSMRTHIFQAYPKFKDLILSPPSQLDHQTIQKTVTEYFRYSTLSHTWDTREPLFHDVLPVSVYDLQTSPTNTKLQKFCATSRDAGLKWSWSDTCCIDKTDGPVLQESLTSMYQWYHESSLTLVHLKGVLSPLEANPDLDPLIDAFVHCIWNTRAWTLQEYFASSVIRFYTEDWEPYLRDTNASNDKAHPAVTRQMALATGVETRIITSLQPGSDNVREKLRLASRRVATREEDTAYSLFGLLGVSMSAIYGEGHKALGRLLETVLYRSGDATILAWVGKASDHNSCLPAEITVYTKNISSFVPSPIERSQLETAISAASLSPMHQESAIQLYDHVLHLPSPRLVSSRLSLSCIAFPITSPQEVFTSGDSNDTFARIYTATASALGKVEIKTTDELAGLNNLVLVHPWLESLLDPIFTSPRQSDDADSDSGQPPQLARALRLLFRLRQPFGALLLAPRNHREFKRIATDHLIRVQVPDDISLEELLEHANVDVLDIL